MISSQDDTEGNTKAPGSQYTETLPIGRYRYEFTQWLPLTLGVNKRGEQIEFDVLSAEGGRREM